MSDAPVAFRLFGGVNADRGGRAVDLGHTRQRCVLAVLLAEANTPVPVEELIGRVWAGGPPVRARESLQSYLTRLRRALPEVPITRTGAGYLISVDEAAIDLHRFRALAASARQTGDPAQLEAALAVWRGEPFAGLDVPWARSLRAALALERAAIELELVDTLLRLGRHNEVLPALTARVELDPLDERLAGQYVLALYRAGRQGDALSHYERVRGRLADELGVDPGPDLSAIHQQILNGQAAPTPAAPVAPVPRQLPAAPSTFSGRSRELAAIDEAMDAAAEPGGTVIISAIGGTGGIGKTWLALHWAHRNVHRFPDGQLFVNLRGFDPSGTPTAPEDAIHGFLDALGVETSSIPPTFEARTALYRSLLTGRRMLVVLDNAADPAQVVPLLPGSATCTVLTTSRNRMINLATAHGATPLALDTLSEVDARGLLAARLGADRLDREPDAVAAILASCAGLPLALGIVAGRALEHPGFPLRDIAEELRDATGRLTSLEEDPVTGVRAMLSWSYAALTAEQAGVFGLLGLAPGPEIGLAAAARLSGLTESRARSVLRSLERVSLLQQHLPDRFRMHDLVRLYAEEQGLSQRDHDAALDRLRDFYAYTAITVDRLRGTGEHPMDMGSPVPGADPQEFRDRPEALAWFTAEHACLTASQSAAFARGQYFTVWLLSWSLTFLFVRRGLLHDDVRSWKLAMRAIEHIDDPQLRIRSDRALSQALFRVGQNEEALARLADSLLLAQRIGDQASTAKLHYALAQHADRVGEFAMAYEHAAAALRIEEQHGDPLERGRAHNMVGTFAARLGRYEEALAHCQAAFDLTADYAGTEWRAEILDSLGYIALHTGRYEQAIAHYDTALALCREVGSLLGEVEVLNSLGAAYQRIGDPGQARTSWEHALEIYRKQGRGKDVEQTLARLAELARDAQARSR
ncbi:MAG TPA: BTAD domain-containing putative transcriptional regulator [Pseudonocardiaceae bacterium]